MPTAVITDSTSYLPDGWALAHDVTVVPVQVIVDAHALDETDAEQASSVITALRAGAQVSTSRPSPVRFASAIDRAVENGSDQAVILTVSAALSGTHEAAVAAAREARIPVQVIDSRSIGMGLGFAVMAAVEAADGGADARTVAGRAAEQARLTEMLFYVDTLEYLRRGGRIATTSALVGQALQVKPILRIADGRVEPVDRVRTASRAIERLVELALESRAGRPSMFAVSDLDAGTRADDVMRRLRDAAPDAEILRCRIGGVVGAHTGPGVVAIAVSPVEAPFSI